MNGREEVYGSIYALIDPRESSHVRYIGWTSKSLEKRLKGHLNDRWDMKSRSYKRNWIDSLRRDGILPEIVLVEKVSVSEWAMRERYWIAELRKRGDRLTNTTAGGDGNFGVPKELFLQWAAKRKGRKHTSEAILKMRLAKIGKPRSALASLKCSLTSRGKCYSPMTPEIRAKISMTLKGRKNGLMTLEQRRLLSEKAFLREARIRANGGRMIGEHETETACLRIKSLGAEKGFL